jgi:hypothetical protein
MYVSFLYFSLSLSSALAVCGTSAHIIIDTSCILISAPFLLAIPLARLTTYSRKGGPRRGRARGEEGRNPGEKESGTGGHTEEEEGAGAALVRKPHERGKHAFQ